MQKRAVRLVISPPLMLSHLSSHCHIHLYSANVGYTKQMREMYRRAEQCPPSQNQTAGNRIHKWHQPRSNNTRRNETTTQARHHANQNHGPHQLRRYTQFHNNSRNQFGINTGIFNRLAFDLMKGKIAEYTLQQQRTQITQPPDLREHLSISQKRRRRRSNLGHFRKLAMDHRRPMRNEPITGGENRTSKQHRHGERAPTISSEITDVKKELKPRWKQPKSVCGHRNPTPNGPNTPAKSNAESPEINIEPSLTAEYQWGDICLDYDE